MDIDDFKSALCSTGCLFTFFIFPVFPQYLIIGLVHGQNFYDSLIYSLLTTGVWTITCLVGLIPIAGPILYWHTGHLLITLLYSNSPFADIASYIFWGGFIWTIIINLIVIISIIISLIDN